MPIVPITFTHLDKEIHGQLQPVSGGGSGLWHLMVDNYYQGQLINTTHYGWQFTSNTKKFDYLSEFFGEYVVAWYE